MLLTEFKREIIAKPPGELTDWFLRSETVEAFPTPEKYNEFQAAVMTLYPNAEKVAVAVTANWSFSLNPNKNFKTYDHREAPLGSNLVFGFQPNYKPPRERLNRSEAR